MPCLGQKPLKESPLFNRVAQSHEKEVTGMLTRRGIRFSCRERYRMESSQGLLCPEFIVSSWHLGRLLS